MDFVHSDITEAERGAYGGYGSEWGATSVDAHFTHFIITAIHLSHIILHFNATCSFWFAGVALQHMFLRNIILSSKVKMTLVKLSICYCSLHPILSQGFGSIFNVL